MRAVSILHPVSSSSPAILCFAIASQQRPCSEVAAVEQTVFTEAPERIYRPGAKVRGQIFFGRAPPLFGSKSTISRFGERCRDGQCSLVNFLFAVLLLKVSPRAQPFVKVGATCPRALWNRRHWAFIDAVTTAISLHAM